MSFYVIIEHFSDNHGNCYNILANNKIYKTKEKAIEDMRELFRQNRDWCNESSRIYAERENYIHNEDNEKAEIIYAAYAIGFYEGKISEHLRFLLYWIREMELAE